MKKINVLYISGSLGLGQITRDIAIAGQLRKLLPEVEIEWLAADPVTMVLKVVENTFQLLDSHEKH